MSLASRFVLVRRWTRDVGNVAGGRVVSLSILSLLPFFVQGGTDGSEGGRRGAGEAIVWRRILKALTHSSNGATLEK